MQPSDSILQAEISRYFYLHAFTAGKDALDMRLLNSQLGEDLRLPIVPLGEKWVLFSTDTLNGNFDRCSGCKEEMQELCKTFPNPTPSFDVPSATRLMPRRALNCPKVVLLTD